MQKFYYLFFPFFAKSETEFILGSTIQEPLKDGAIIPFEPSPLLRNGVTSYWQKKALQQQNQLSDGYLTDLDEYQENDGILFNQAPIEPVRNIPLEKRPFRPPKRDFEPVMEPENNHVETSPPKANRQPMWRPKPKPKPQQKPHPNVPQKNRFGNRVGLGKTQGQTNQQQDNGQPPQPTQPPQPWEIAQGMGKRKGQRQFTNLKIPSDGKLSGARKRPFRYSCMLMIYLVKFLEYIIYF